MKIPPEVAPVESEILQFFADRNFERSRRFAPQAYDPQILRAYLEKENNPQWRYRTIHIAGTVGKGSATTMVARALSAMGMRTGTYLSPHFVSLTERVLIDDKPIPAEKLASAWRNLLGRGGLERLSFFDAMTALAFRYFAEERCDYAVIETGLGGRLDSTNNLHAEAAIITTIGMDHMNVLGNTLEQIAAEKAGIIQRGQKVYAMPQDARALAAIYARCTEVNATLEVLEPQGDDFMEYNRDFVRQFLRAHFAPEVEVMAKCEAAIAEPIFGRWSVLSAKPRIVFDSAHNAAGITALAQLVNRQPESRCNIFINTMLERNLAEFGQILHEKIDKIMRLYLFPMNGTNYYTGTPASIALVQDAQIRALFAEPDTLHLFTGSMGIYAELRRRFRL